MQTIQIAGNVGNVKEVRDVGDDCVLNFSIAVDNGKDKNGERRESTWYDCSLWGKRARSLAPYITKGSKLALHGRPTARAHEGKAYLGVTVSELTFMSSKADSDVRGASAEQGYARETEYKSVSGNSYPEDSDIPF